MNRIIVFNTTKEMASIYVRTSKGEKLNYSIELGSSVKELKEMIASSQQIETEHITLVFKGKILQDTATLAASGNLLWQVYDFRTCGC